MRWPTLHKRSADTSDLPEVINISTDRLQLIIQSYAASRKAAGEWTTPLSVALTLWLLVPVTDFRDRFGLSSAEWRTVVVMLAVGASVWFTRRVYSAVRAPNANDLLLSICQKADRLDDHRGLFLFECRDVNGVDRVLVYYDEVWECYLLPHANVQAWDLADVSIEGPLRQYAGRLIGMPPDQLAVTPLRPMALRSTKFSEFYKREKSYTFEFLHVRAHGKIRPELLQPSFTAGGREYHWLSIAELMQDKATNVKNKDVLHHLEGRVAEFFLQLPDTFSTPLSAPTETDGPATNNE